MQAHKLDLGFFIVVYGVVILLVSAIAPWLAALLLVPLAGIVVQVYFME